ncbi:MAG TPA: aspartate-semialdehyde dehydrogenase [Terriglobia bacterium]|jgi:aspartate-semialdehyde dehydrogenase|nr:aspartate-semialdehyde dehydrogenase [Terriglobia bacterium]
MTKKLEVGVLGATGMVGQRLASLLENHPWFELRWLGASDRSAGKKYAEACTWRLRAPMPHALRDVIVNDCFPNGIAPQLLFASLDSKVAGEVEGAFARAGHAVVSNSSYYRMEPDVPLVIPEVNPGHLALVRAQRRERGWSGMIVTNPNCTTVGLVMSLAPLSRAFGLTKVMMTSMQAVSGAGYPGVPTLDILGNVIPYIGGEEEKVEAETRKLLGSLDTGSANGGRVQPGDFGVSAHCNRVAVEDGHTETVSVALRSQATREQVLAAWTGFEAPSEVQGLPSAPQHPIVVREEPDRPQPKFDVDAEGGMAAVIGRLRSCPVLDYKYVVLSHNTIRGAAGAALLNAELMKAGGYLD